MSEERLDHIEKMLAQLIQMVGHNNAVTEELRQDVAGLKQGMATLEARVEKGFADIVTMVNLLGEKVDKIETTQAHHSDMLDVLATRTTHQEAEIQGLKRAK